MKFIQILNLNIYLDGYGKAMMESKSTSIKIVATLWKQDFGLKHQNWQEMYALRKRRHVPTSSLKQLWNLIFSI